MSTTHKAVATASGYTSPRFSGVHDAFESNLRNGDDLGASVAVYHHGDLVVDLRGGARDTSGTPYPEDDLAFALPGSGVAFAFLTNRAVPDPTPHTRLWRLLSAVAAAL
ncbi:hypothetical protein ACWDDN_22620 [Streptomyces griseoruber]